MNSSEHFIRLLSRRSLLGSVLAYEGIRYEYKPLNIYNKSKYEKYFFSTAFS